MKNTEYKGYQITNHKDGRSSSTLSYDRADGTTEVKTVDADSHEDLYSQIDAFIAECENWDNSYNETLVDLSKQINELQTNIESGIKTVQEKTLEALNNVIKCGELLSKAKEILANGKWGTWLKTNCPGISSSTDKRYRQLYKKTLKDSSYVTQAKSIRQAYLLYGLINETPEVPFNPTPTTTTTATSTNTTSTSTNSDGNDDDDGDDEEEDNDNDTNEKDVTIDIGTDSDKKPSLTIQQMVDLIINNLDHLKDDEKRESINTISTILNWLSVDELVDLIIFRFNHVEDLDYQETILDNLKPLVELYNQYRPAKKKSKKSNGKQSDADKLPVVLIPVVNIDNKVTEIETKDKAAEKEPNALELV